MSIYTCNLICGLMRSLEEAKRCIRFWTRPPPPPPAEFLSPPAKSLFRSTSRSDSLTSHTPTRSYSHGALAAYEVPLPQSTVPSVAPTPARQPSVKRVEIVDPVKPIAVPKARPPPVLKIIASSPRSSRRVSFPALQSPSQSITGTTTEHVNSSITPSSPTRHGVSGGRFSISGVLGMSRTESMSGAVSNLARLVEEYPVDTSRSVSPRSPTMVPVRVRTESTPLLGGPSQTSGRRKSEDWSSRSWRMGGGPGAAEALGEFGASIKKKESEELLSGSSGSANGSGLSASSVNLQGEGTGKTRMVRSRGGSLGRDSRLYPSSEEEVIEWGVEVGGVRLGECSALTGEGELARICRDENTAGSRLTDQASKRFSSPSPHSLSRKRTRLSGNVNFGGRTVSCWSIRPGMPWLRPGPKAGSGVAPRLSKVSLHT